MATKGRDTWWLHLTVAVATLSTWWELAESTDPLGTGCSTVFVENATVFYNNLNATLSALRTQLSEEDKRFATDQSVNSSDPVFAMAQCRTYLSAADCVACYDDAVLVVRNCSTAAGARVIYDNCILRYEDYDFFRKSYDNGPICGNRDTPAAFREEGQKLLEDLQLATPKTRGYFAAAKKEIVNVQNPLTIYGVAQCVATISEDGCRGCLNVAYVTIQVCLSSGDGRIIDGACFMRFSDRRFFADNQTTDLKPFLRNSSSTNKAFIRGVGGGAGFAIIVTTLVLWYIFSRKLKIAMRGDILGATKLQRPNKYSYRDLELATDNFSEENKLGQGSFGAVYKATLKNGTILAVKKLDMSHSRAKADFESETRLISNVHHRNLVRLLGRCSKGSELLLVYEYMENGSLDRFLYGDKRGSLTWKQRRDIILGTARGIAYLHEQYHVTIIHRDIKPSNILLNTEFEAKIADFGLVRPLPESQSHLSTKFAGTLGYTAPEYAVNGHLSEKVDVYSFGVVTLEIISGRRCTDMNENSETAYLLEEAWKLYERGMHHELADVALGPDEYEVDDLKKMVEIALVCTQSPPTTRPTMSEILVMILSDESVVGIAPSGSSASNATISFSDYTGR